MRPIKPQLRTRSEKRKLKRRRKRHSHIRVLSRRLVRRGAPTSLSAVRGHPARVWAGKDAGVPHAGCVRSNRMRALQQDACAPTNMSTIAQHDLYRLIGEANGRGERVVVATVAHTRGSTPQRRGAKMLFFENGKTAGTVGGGCVEAEVWAEAREAMRSGQPALHHFSLTADEASEEGMVCGGTMDIFIDIWKTDHS